MKLFGEVTADAIKMMQTKTLKRLKVGDLRGQKTTTNDGQRSLLMRGRLFGHNWNTRMIEVGTDGGDSVLRNEFEAGCVATSRGSLFAACCEQSVIESWTLMS